MLRSMPMARSTRRRPPQCSITCSAPSAGSTCMDSPGFLTTRTHSILSSLSDTHKQIIQPFTCIVHCNFMPSSWKGRAVNCQQSCLAAATAVHYSMQVVIIT